MAKKATQAIETTQEKATPEVTAAESEAQVIFAAGLKEYGDKEFSRVVMATKAAMAKVRGTDKEINSLTTIIEQKRSGNTAVLHKLAIDCVKACTNEEGVADLARAADMMETACKYVEAITELDFKRENPEAVEAKIRNIVPSWPVLRTNFIGAMRRAKLNPNDYPNPSGIVTAFKNWKENPANADQVNQTGRAPRMAGQTAQAGTAAANAAPAAVGEGMKSKLTDSAISTLRNITVALQLLDEKTQLQGVNILAAALTEIRKLDPAFNKAEAAKDKEAGVQTTKRTNPARVPESNQIAQ